ncbi:MAG: hypothetical protein PVSMB1_08360 [Gemmatimonadaceae bacterium]
MKRMVRALDRYVFIEFWKIFVTTALGFPILLNIIDLTDNLDTYMGRHLSIGRIVLSYVYWLPDSMFMVLPAAVLFATVFAIGALTRHSEITAAKASGISFYRFIAPIFAGAIIATVLGLILGELAPVANKKRNDLLQGAWSTSATTDTTSRTRQSVAVFTRSALCMSSSRRSREWWSSGRATAPTTRRT